jgi:hypothetical protein
MATIKIEGQTIKGDDVGITDEIANDDDLLKAALAPTWPDVRTATITREGGKDGKELVVRVTKKAGTKGVNNVVEVEEAEERLQALKEAEAARVRKLEDVALAADELLRVHNEFNTCGSGYYAGALSEYIDALDEKLDVLGGDEIATIRSARRFA